MTLRRAVALAQALMLIMLLLPGPHLVGPSPVRAAVQPVEPEIEASMIYDAAGKGIGCRAGTRKYKGPGLPKDPPWPPGAEPTPTPEPTPGPEPDPDPDIDAPAEPDATEAPAAAGSTTFVAASVRLAQADISNDPPLTKPRRGAFISGIDVSHHNGDIDFSKVKDAGHEFVFMKATQDIDFLDPRFLTNADRAREAGLAVGAYHFFDYTLDGRAQADHFLDRIDAAGGLDGTLPPVVDVECWRPIGPSIHAVSAARLRDFVDRVYERSGRMPIVYTSVYMWREVVGNADGFEDLPLWAACWGCEAPPSLAPGWNDWAFWQTGLYRIPGVGRLDGNYFSGSDEQLDGLRLQPLTIEGGAIATSRSEVELDLGGRVATHVRSSPDGESWSSWSRVRSAPTATIPEAEGEHTLHVQLRYGRGLTSPVFRDSIIVDRTPPLVGPLTVSLRTGSVEGAGERIPVSVAWSARDDVAGLSDATVIADCTEGGNDRTEAPGSAAPGEDAAWSAEAAVVGDAACDITAIAHDGAGNTSHVTASGITTRLVEGPSASVSGQQVGVVARRGPDGGRAAVLLDGDAVGLVDLSATEPGEPEVVFVTELPVGTHEVTLEATGSDGAGGDPGAAVVGFVTLGREG